jgi:K+-sensing histidine kinase KdpD
MRQGLEFTVACPADLTWRIDEGDAFEIMGNVLDNAAKWASHRVEARIWRDGGRLFIRVQDDGPGFSDTQALPQRRVRLDEQVPGHGIGLAVVSDLVASHQGELKIRAGRGAAHNLTLRCAPLDSPAVMPGLTRHPRWLAHPYGLRVKPARQLGDELAQAEGRSPSPTAQRTAL